MAKRSKHEHNRQQKRTEQVIDNYARVLQIVAIISVVVIFIINGTLETADVPIWVPAGLLGVAVGLSPEQIGQILVDMIKAMFTAKRR